MNPGFTSPQNIQGMQNFIRNTCPIPTLSTIRLIIGVMGQSTGIVIYARNLRLIGKQKRRALAATAKLAD